MNEISSTQPLGFATTVRMLQANQSTFRLRTGIWNYEEVTFATEDLSQAGQEVVSKILGMMALGSFVDVEAILDSSKCEPIEVAHLLQLFSQLQQAGYVEANGEAQAQATAIRALFGGQLAPPSGSDQPRSILLLTDDSRPPQSIPSLVAGLNVTVDDGRVLAGLRSVDLTGRFDAVATEDDRARASALISEFDAVVCAFERLPVAALRNLNRIAFDSEKPLLIGAVDGPFVVTVGIRSPYSGCFECYEMRSLSRQQDHLAYHRFVESERNSHRDVSAASPLMDFLFGLVSMEASLLGATGSSRFSGRALNVYLPTFEIQVQDLLRMPGCPCCGHVAQERMQELNFNTRRVMDDVISSALNRESVR